ncbi:MAG: hypothetical protein N2201_03925, partial [candidate division WOR-3 bacterium]|nr:hypothetical protein [candidate division WOR-3 bacterium]
LSFMPGSRPSEVNRNLLLILRIIHHLQKEYPKKFEYIILTDKNNAHLPKIHIGTQYKYELMAHSKLIVLCSGTASIESTILNTPFISFYQLSPITHLIAKKILKTPYFTLTNIIANKKIVPEFAQPKFNILYDSITYHINNGRLLKDIKNQLQEVSQKLVIPNCGSKIARTIINFSD